MKTAVLNEQQPLRAKKSGWLPQSWFKLVSPKPRGSRRRFELALTLFCLLASALPAKAFVLHFPIQNRAYQNPVPSAVPLRSVAVLGPSHWVAAGVHGAAYVTADAGQSWTPLYTGTDKTLQSIVSPSPGVLVAAGIQGVILKSTDGGYHWMDLSQELDADLKALSFPTPSTGYVVGAGGAMMKTTDGGESWEFLDSGYGQDLNGVAFFSADEGYAVGNGVILRTTNGGYSWSFAGMELPQMHAVDVYGANEAVAVGEYGAVSPLPMAGKPGKSRRARGRFSFTPLNVWAAASSLPGGRMAAAWPAPCI